MGKGNRQFLEEICDGCTSRCLLKYLVLDVHHDSRRLLTQVKVMDKYKYEESERQGKDIGWDSATKLWVEKGYAKRFDILYVEGLRYDTLYRSIIE